MITYTIPFHCKPGDVLYDRGDVAEELAFVSKGTVRVSGGGRTGTGTGAVDRGRGRGSGPWVDDLHLVVVESGLLRSCFFI